MKVVLFLLVVLVGCADADPKASSNNTNSSNNANNPSNNPTGNNSNNSNNFVTSVDISQFDQTCEWDTDCEVVDEYFCGCSCQDAAINKSDMEAYRQATAAINCPPPPTPPEPTVSCGACAQTIPACFEGVCIARQPFFIEPPNYDVQCEIDDDCVLIFEGELCSNCKCGGIAVNKESYEERTPVEAQCTPGPSVCDCAAWSNVRCSDNICTAF